MGKRSLLCFLLLGLLFFSSVCAEAPATMTERETADRLEQEFGIRILIGDEVTEVPSDDFVVHPAGEYINILMEMLSLTETEQALKTLEETLLVYPEGFFQRYAKPLVFCLAGEITDPEWVPQSVTSGFCHEVEDCIYLFLDIRFMFPDLVHHKIWHSLEALARGAFPDGDDLNQDGFAYAHVLGDDTGFDPEWFCRDYSVMDDEEDRATVYEAYFTESPEWWEEHPHIRKKLDRILRMLEEEFGFFTSP